jgi:hypothetical protein
MSEGSATVTLGVVASGSPAYLDRRPVSKWPAASASANLVSSLTGAFTVMITPRREAVFLTRGHQRVLDRALRRSVRIIA